MKQADYLIIVASINENMKLAHTIMSELDALGISGELLDIVALDLPMYTSKTENEAGIPDAVGPISQQMKACRGYIVIAPEYNYSLPPTLSNFVAWISRIGDDFRALFSEKPILLATFSGGGGDDVLNAMRVQFTKLGAVVIPRQLLATYTQPLNKESLDKTLAQLVRLSG